MHNFLRDRINQNLKVIREWKYPEMRNELWIVRVTERPIIADHGQFVTVKFEYRVSLLDAETESENDRPSINFLDGNHALDYAERLANSL